MSRRPPTTANRRFGAELSRGKFQSGPYLYMNNAWCYYEKASLT